MEDRYQVRTGFNLADFAAKGPHTRWRPLLNKAVMGLVTLATLSPLVDSVQAQSGSSAAGVTARATQADKIDADWIWSPRLDVSSAANQGEVYFRKKFTLLKPQKAELTLAAGDEFELFINGEMIATGQSFGMPTKLDPTPFLESGTNVIAVRVKHLDSRHVGFAMKMRIKEVGEARYRVLRSDSTWRSYTAKAHEWHKNSFNAKSWLTSKAINRDAGVNGHAPQVAVFGGAAKRNRAGGSLAVEANDRGWNTTSKSRVKLSPMQPETAANDAAMTASVAAFAKVKNDAETAVAAEVKEAVEMVETVKEDSSFVPDVVRAPLASTTKEVKLTDVARSSFSPRDSAPVSTPTIVGGSDSVPPVVPAITSQVSVARKSAPMRPVPKAVDVPPGIKVNPEFSVTTVLNGRQAGSVIAMEFNEYGQLLLSQEGGPLLIADLVAQSPGENQPVQKQVRVFCNEVSSCQGILPLNGDVFVTGEGPDGQALYRLADKDGDGQAEIADTLLKFTGELGEHGPHGVSLGPDGMLYVVVGNESRLKNTVSRRSPYQSAYQGDLQPNRQHPRVHRGNAALHGGTVVRVGVDGSRPETVAGGIHNAYDLAFDQNGELFIHDSEVETDRETTWYRPPMVFNVTAGAELGWRSGWSKFASYYLDQTPSVCETGQGSPAGAVVYQHLAFPKKFQNALFLADWSQGKILSLKPKPSGAGYVGQTETFLSGKSLNVCDLAVGPDGALYFSTGGSGNSGGVYKVSWNGQIPAGIMTFENDLAKVMRHPQPNSAWARQNIAELRRQMGQEWKDSILGVVTETRNPPQFRIRAMQLAALYGPKLPTTILQTLTEDESAAVRAQAARMCGNSLRSADNQLLIGMLRDPSAMVRRKTCEALLRADLPLKHTQLTHLLRSADRIETATARRLLERLDASQWRSDLVNSQDVRLYLNSSLALMTAEPNLENAYVVLSECSEALDGFLSDEDFLDLLRLVQVTVAQGKVESAKIPAFVHRLGEEFPAGSPEINMELVKILSGLDAGDLDGRLATWLQAPTTSAAEKSHAVMHFQNSANTLSGTTRMALSRAMAELKGTPSSRAFNANVSVAAEETTIDPRKASLKDIIAGGDKWPEVVVESFYKMPNPLTDELAASLRTLDQKLVGREDHAAKKVRLGIIALLAQHGSEASFAWLRESFDNEPSRRADLAIGLALDPGSDNWSYLVSSLPIVDDATGKEILEKLATVQRRPKDPIHYRDVIELGYRLQGDATAASGLLAHWTGSDVGSDGDSWQQQMGAWNQWYAGEFPSAAPVATLESVPASLERVADRDSILNTSGNSGGIFIQ